MNIIDSDYLSEKIANAYYSVNIEYNKSIKNIFSKINPKNNMQKMVINTILENYTIAKKNKIPLCQDTGTPVIFIEKPANYIIKNDFENILKKYIAKISKEKGLRLSIINNPLNKKRIVLPNPPIVYYLKTNKKKMRIIVMAKGGGSENLNRIFMLTPSISEKEIIEKIVKTVKESGSKGCPPYILGITIGGLFENSAINAKKILTGKFPYNTNKMEKKIANEILKKANELKIGIHGLGFGPTVIDVRLKILSTHIASMPLSITFQCFQERVKSFYI